MKAAAVLARLFFCLAFVAGGGVASAFAEHITDLKQKAAEGVADAQYQLGEAYYHGIGINEDEAEAIKWFHLSAKQGHPDAQYFLGLLYQSGNYVLPNYKESARMYHLAAEQGHFRAQYRLGLMYLNDKGVAKSYSEAYIWFALAALLHTNLSLMGDAIKEQRQVAEEKLTTDELNQAQAEAAKRLGEIKKKQAAAQ